MFYSNRLGSLTNAQLQAALDRFNLGTLIETAAISTGLFGQNLHLTSTGGRFVFRGSPHYEWQLPTERFFADYLHRHTAVPVPWPYLVEPASDLFPWPWGFAIMPRLPGSSLAEAGVYGALSPRQRVGLATAMGEALAAFQAPAICGSYDPATGTIRPFAGGYLGRVTSRIRENIGLIRSTGAIDEADERWLDELVERAARLPEPEGYTVVHEDFNRNNMTTAIDGDKVAITGVFDLMTCHFGDGLADLARPFCMFLDDEDGGRLARAFVRAYLGRRESLDLADIERSLLYVVDERLLIWEYCHRPGHDCRDWGVTGSLRRWLGRYLDALESALTSSDS